MTVYLLNIFFLKNLQKILLILLKWLFWTSINLDIIFFKNCILAEVCINIVCATSFMIFI